MRRKDLEPVQNLRSDDLCAKQQSILITDFEQVLRGCPLKITSDNVNRKAAEKLNSKRLKTQVKKKTDGPETSDNNNSNSEMDY